MLTGRFNGGLEGALDRHEARIVLLEDVEEMRKDVRDDHPASGRVRSAKKPDGVVFDEIAEQRG